MISGAGFSQNERLRNLFASFRTGVLEVSTDGILLNADASIVEILHCPSLETLLGTPMSDIFANPAELTELLAGLAPATPVRNYSYVLRCFDQLYITVDISARLLAGEPGKQRVELTIQDCSQGETSGLNLLEKARRAASTLGEPFFNSLVAQLANMVGATYALAGERIQEGGVEKIRTIAVSEHQRLLDPFEYNLRGTPSERVILSGPFACLSGLKSSFPEDKTFRRLGGEAFVGVPLVDSNQTTLGLLAVIYRRPLESSLLVESILKVFALRASIELERYLALQSVKTSEMRYRALIENSADGLAILSSDGTVQYISPSSQGIIGLSTDDHLGRHYSGLFHPDERESTAQVFAETLANPGKRTPFLFRSLRPESETRWIEGIATNLLDEPSVQGVVLTFRDVTERTQAEARIRENEDRFRQMAENIQDGLSIIHQDRVVFANKRIHEILGRTPKEILQMTGLEFAAPEEQERLRAIMEKAQQTGQMPKQLSYWVLRKDGTRRYIHNRYSMLHSEDEWSDRYVITTDITEQKLSEEELRFRADFERLMIRISTRLINVRIEEMTEELEVALAEVGVFEDVDYCHIFLFSHDMMKISCIAEWHRPTLPDLTCAQLLDRFVPNAPWWQSKLRAFEACVFSSVSEIPAEEHAFRKMIESMGIKSSIDVPIVLTGRLVGFLGLSAVRSERVWSADEIALHKLLAEIIANALERRDTEARADRQMANLASLHTIDKTITSKTELGPVLSVLLEQTTSQLRVDAADILLFDARTGKLTYGDDVGFYKARSSDHPAHLEHALVSDIITSRQMTRASIPQEWLAFLSGEEFTTYFGMPLVARDEVNGVLELYHRQPLEPGEDWLRFMTMLSEQAAIAVDNVTMFQTLQHSNQELSEAYDTTLEGWARALELRDQETEGHSRRVPWLALRLAKEMGLSDEEMVHLRRGSLLHDIGKMGIPDSILAKPGPLDDEEWAIMRQHPVFAYNLLSSIPFLKPALDVPYCHHEHWDGSGYPRGLKGTEIPITARIFAIVDVWDALRTKRRYRDAWDDLRVRDYLAGQSGKHFDPMVVKAFLDLLATGTRTFA